MEQFDAKPEFELTHEERVAFDSVLRNLSTFAVPTTLCWDIRDLVKMIAVDRNRLKAEQQPPVDQAPARTVAWASLLTTSAALQESMERVRASLPRTGDHGWVAWRSFYSYVFDDIKPVMDRHFRLLGINFDYWDPDTSYEEDAKAYADALQMFVLQNAPGLNALYGVSDDS